MPDTASRSPGSGEDGRPRLRCSIFPRVPPYHVFMCSWEHYLEPPCPGLREEEWQFPAQIMPVVRDVVAHAGFKITKGVLRCDDEKEVLMAGFIWDNLPLVEKAMDAIDFKRLLAGVKINKFPGFLDLNRKDALWTNFRAMQQQFGQAAFGFHPDTFQLPAEHQQLVERMEREKYSKVYIVKLPNSFCGIGACVIDHPKKIPEKKKVHTKDKKKVIKEDPIIVQSYIPNPLLIHGYKFDFRIYVLVTSINPLRIYLYRDGMVRFATEKFSLEPEDLANTFIHLTNFAMTKKGEFVADYPSGTQANKWSIYELWDWFRERGEDPEPFWERTKDVIIKTILCGHKNIDAMVKESVGSFYNNYNILGFDIFMDTEHKPHLLEVNTIPSMFINKSSEEIDLRLKANIIAESLNISGHHISTGVAQKHKAAIVSHHLGGQAEGPLGFDHRIYCKVPTKAEREKQERFCQAEGSDSVVKDEEGKDEEYDEEEGSCSDSGVSSEEVGRGAEGGEGILERLTPCDVRVLVHSEEELTQCRTFERIFPTTSTEQYFKYMTPNYYDRLLAAWEQGQDPGREEGRGRLAELTTRGVHLEVPAGERRPAHPPPNCPTPPRKVKMPHIYRR